jgi:putative ABC transport system permease protein
VAWKVVGIFDANRSAFDSEVWCDAAVLNGAYMRPVSSYQSATARMISADALEGVRKTLTGDPRLQVMVDSETEYYAKESQMLTALITGLGSLVAIVMGVGAIFGALNTMYAAVAERAREIATLRAVGFPARSVVVSFVFEALFIAALGGLLGCLVVLPINGLTTGTMNWQTFSHMSFAFRITPLLLGFGIVFALAMGILGGVPPAIRAARLPVASALRDL